MRYSKFQRIKSTLSLIKKTVVYKGLLTLIKNIFIVDSVYCLQTKGDNTKNT